MNNNLKTVFTTLPDAMQNKSILEAITQEKWDCFYRRSDNNHFWVLGKRNDPPPPQELQLNLFERN